MHEILFSYQTLSFLLKSFVLSLGQNEYEHLELVNKPHNELEFYGTTLQLSR